MYHKIIVNPAAGNGRSRRLLPMIEEGFKEKGLEYDIYMTKGPRDAIKAAEKAAQSFDRVIAVGGDGTVNEVVNGMAGSRAVLGTLPTGTGNDYALALGFSPHLKEALNALLKGQVKAVDLGRVKDQYFVNCVGVGFDGTVAHYANNGSKFTQGKWIYVVAILKTLITYQPVQMEILLDDKCITLSPTLVAVGIGQSYGGGMKILPEAIMDDGLFDICIVENMKRFKTLYSFPRVIKGRHTGMKEVQMYRSQEVTLNMSAPLKLHIEGEVYTKKYLHFTIIPRGINILLPQTEGGEE